MLIDMSHLIVDLWRGVGEYGYPTLLRMTPWRPTENWDYFPADRPIEYLFMFTSTDYDAGEDLVGCPCGWLDERFSLLGDVQRQARDHVREAHPDWRPLP